VQLDKALDRGLLFSAIDVVDEAGHTVPGTIAVPRGEREWTLTPDAPWTAGHYELRVSDDIEDLAGNSPRRVFDADLRRDRAPSAAGDPGILTRPFTIVPSSVSP
jgi:hypothetical protein